MAEYTSNNPNIRMGLQIPLFTYPGGTSATMFDTVASIAQAGEAAGFDSVWVMDHFYQLPGLGQPQEPMFETYTILSALAAVTSKVRLGAMVGGVTYRNPAFLAKSVTCLDVISKGRAIWGIGAGWFELEHNAYGYDFGTFGQRFEKLEEALQIARSMFVNDTTTFDGKWFSVTDAFNVPKPVQSQGIPVLIGGSGEKKHCAWSPSTAMPATCSATRRRCDTSCRCSTNTVNVWAAIRPTSAARVWARWWWVARRKSLWRGLPSATACRRSTT